MKILFLIISFSFSQLALADTDTIKIGNFSSEDLIDWEDKEFKNLTIYKFVTDENQKVLKAVSNNSASGMFKEQTIDLEKYPFINWQWKTTNRSNSTNEREKRGDDYSARLYVIVSGGLFFWKTKSLNYVWSKNEQIESIWKNAFAPNNAMMLAVRTKTDKLNTWYQEKRNIYLDLQKAFGKKMPKIHGIAIMADTDNAGGTTTSYFGDIYFSTK